MCTETATCDVDNATKNYKKISDSGLRKVGLDTKMTLHHPPTANSMSLISQLFLARFKPNFKGRFVGSSTTITATTWTTTTITTTTTKATFHLLLT